MFVQPFKIDGSTIPTPTEYTFDIEDLSSEEMDLSFDGEFLFFDPFTKMKFRLGIHFLRESNILENMNCKVQT